MAQHPFYSQSQDVSDGITEFESIRPSPLSETVPLFGAGIRSSTWPIASNGSHDISCDYTEYEYNGGVKDRIHDTEHGVGYDYPEDEYDGEDDNQMQDVEDEASDSGSVEPLIFEPIEPPDGYTPLTFRPKILTRRILLALVAFYLAIFGLIGYLSYRALHAQVWTIRNVNYYLAARYLPAVTGVCTNALFLTTTSTLRRILPFIHLADQKKPKKRYRMENNVCARYFPLAPRITWTIGFLVLGNFAFRFTIAAKATLFDVEDTGRGAWLVSVRLGAAVYLSFTYLLAASINVFITIRYAGCSTGLKENWDPTSLADIILLFTPTDTVPTLDHGLNSNRWYRMIRQSKARYRLGYWKIINIAERTSSVIYGIREIDTVIPTTNTRHLQRFKNYMDQKSLLNPCCGHSDRLGQLPDQPFVQCLPREFHDPPCHCQHRPRCSHYPYRKGPYAQSLFWRIPQLFLLVTIVFCLSFALVRIWWFKGIVLQKGGWLIQSNDMMPTPNGTQSVTSRNEVVSIPGLIRRRESSAKIRDFLAILLMKRLPIFIVTVVGGSIETLDIQHRWVQPFTNMYEKASSASDSLLLDYMTVSPLEVIPQAWAKKHLKVVYVGVLSALKWVPPLIITGLSTVNETGSEVTIQLSPVAASAAIIWLSVYIHSLTSTPPKRRLPRDVGSLYDLFCFFYDSQLRWYPEFARAAFSRDMTKEKLYSRLRLVEDEFRFGLVGDPQNPHPGFDIADHVIWVAPIPGLFHRMRNIVTGRKDRTSSSDHGSDVNSESDAISMDEFDASTSTHHRGPLAREDPQWTSHSTAVN